MARGSRAILLDSMASGRVAHGERWSFREMDSRTEVLVCGRPAYINRTKMTPSIMNPQQFGLMEEFDYMTTVGLFADGHPCWKEISAAANEELKSSPEVLGAATELSRGGCIVKFLARSAPDMTAASKKLWDLARSLIAGLPPFDHRKY